MKTAQRQRDSRGVDGAGVLRGSLPLLAICVGFFVIQVDATAVNVALPDIARSLGANLSRLQWVIDAYTLALAGLMLTAGSIADRLGARRVFTIGIGVFTFASALCSLAPDLELLIAARVVQGVGAAALLPCSLALIAHEYPDHRGRAHALGAWGAAGSVGVAAGPVLGGALVTAVSWRAIFLINIPIGVLETWLLLRYVSEAPRRAPESLDGGGLGLSIVSLGLVTAAFIEAGAAGWISSDFVFLLVLGLVGVAAFVHIEQRRPTPMLPMSLFGSRRFSSAIFVGLCFNLSLYGSLLCLSIYLQQTRGETPIRTGLLLLPMAVMVAIGSVASGRITGRLGHRLPLVAGLLSGFLGALVLASVVADTSIAVLVAGTLALGLCSIAMPAMSSLAVGSAPSDRPGLASGILNTARQAGGALGVAVLGSLLARSGPTPLRYTFAVPFSLAGAILLLAAIVSWLGTRGEVVGERARATGGSDR